jgi:hypothetical protein
LATAGDHLAERVASNVNAAIEPSRKQLRDRGLPRGRDARDQDDWSGFCEIHAATLLADPAQGGPISHRE